ncbi:phospholipase D-like domain-containing protein [Candidatus Uabimicrobium sp. HlEnr_7]|uniref:phospholipase D-like domain-containing protein n=1 Tax=Candidatus Uabimicrobium helgolandensis TaxID=3095367 RepID=UPI003558EF97
MSGHDLKFANTKTNKVAFFSDAKEMMSKLRDDILAAKESVYIAGWRLDPFIHLTPDQEDNKDETLFDVLQEIPNVKVKILLWDRPTNENERVQDIFSDLKHVEIVSDEVGRNPKTVLLSHHQKFTVIDLKMAYIGGIDLAGGRWDNCEHLSFASVNHPTLYSYLSPFVEKYDYEDEYNPYTRIGVYDFHNEQDLPKEARVGWHDIHAKVEGPAVGDIAEVFCGRWNKLYNSSKFVQKMMGRTNEKLSNWKRESYEKTKEHTSSVRVVCSIDNKCIELQDDTVVTTYRDAYIDYIAKAQRSIYIENQYFIKSESEPHGVVVAVVERIKKAMQQNQKFEVIILLPAIPGFHPEEMIARGIYDLQLKVRAFVYKELEEVAQQYGKDVHDYVGFFTLANKEQGTNKLAQIYVHSKLMIVDEQIAILGSANINKRSFTGTWDTEIGIVVEDQIAVSNFRRRLAQEHFQLSDISETLLNQFTKVAQSEETRLWLYPLEDKRVYGFNGEAPIAKHYKYIPKSVFDNRQPEATLDLEMLFEYRD